MEVQEENKQSQMSALDHVRKYEQDMINAQTERDKYLAKAQSDVLKQFKIDAAACQITNEQIAEAFGIRIAESKPIVELNGKTEKEPATPNFYYEGHILRTISAYTLKKEPWRALYLSGDINKYRVSYAKFLGGTKGIDEKWDIVYKDSKEPKPDWAKMLDEKNVKELDLTKYKV